MDELTRIASKAKFIGHCPESDVFLPEMTVLLPGKCNMSIAASDDVGIRGIPILSVVHDNGQLADCRCNR